MTELTTPTPASKPVRMAPPAKPQQFVQMLINLALMIWTIRDIRRRSDDEINGKRKLWMMAAFAPPIGPIAYFIFGRKRNTQPTEVPLETSESA
jgi:Phospholipase_D-nuclease N-terminal